MPGLPGKSQSRKMNCRDSASDKVMNEVGRMLSLEDCSVHLQLDELCLPITHWQQGGLEVFCSVQPSTIFSTPLWGHGARQKGLR